PPPFRLGQDGWKAPELFADPAPLPHPAEDLFAFGLILRRLAEVVEGEPEWLRRAADELTHAEPRQRPPANAALRARLSPHWLLQEMMLAAGWRPDAHVDFVGRAFVFAAAE